MEGNAAGSRHGDPEPRARLFCRAVRGRLVPGDVAGWGLGRGTEVRRGILGCDQVPGGLLQDDYGFRQDYYDFLWVYHRLATDFPRS